MAYDNLQLEPISVVQKLRQLGMYGTFDDNHNPVDNKPAAIQEQILTTVRTDGSKPTHTMGLIDRYDIKLFADELDTKLQTFNPFVKHLFAKNAEMLVNLMRGVQYISKGGFKGSIGSGGNGLDALLLRAEQFADPELNTGVLATGSRTTWQRNIPGAGGVAAPATLQYIIALDNLGVNTHGALVAGSTVATAEAIALLGFADPAASPCVSGFQPTYNTVTYDMQNLSFELVDQEYGYEQIELAQPLFIWPGESGSISVRYFKNGVDELQPIGVWIKISTNMRALASS